MPSKKRKTSITEVEEKNSTQELYYSTSSCAPSILGYEENSLKPSKGLYLKI